MLSKFGEYARCWLVANFLFSLFICCDPSNQTVTGSSRLADSQFRGAKVNMRL
jgi:hypothetical protein